MVNDMGGAYSAHGKHEYAKNLCVNAEVGRPFGRYELRRKDIIKI
jgi:hypothetical protein